jgi:hypothetical protein
MSSQLALTGAGNSGGGATVVIQDSFTDTDGTAIASHVIAPTNTPGHSWVAAAGTWQIQSNKARKTATDTTHQVATVDSGDADCTVTTHQVATVDSGDADCTVSADCTVQSSSFGGLALRAVDSTNNWVVQLDQAGGMARLYEDLSVARASTSLTLNAGTAYTVQAVLSGSTITVTINGGNSMSYGSATNHQSVTTHGLYSFNISLDFDNFKVTNP